MSPEHATDIVTKQSDKLALMGLRFLAFLVDFFLFAFPFRYLHKTFGFPEHDMHELALIALAFFGALGVFEWKLGATPGKLTFRLRVVNEAGQYPGLVRAVVRRSLLAVDLMFAGVVGAASILLTDAARRVGDTMTDTYVVELEQFLEIQKLASTNESIN